MAGRPATPREGWLHILNDEDVVEIENALQVAARAGKALLNLRREDFPLPTLGPRLRQISAGLETGQGFAVVRGLPVESRSEEDARLICWGLGLHLGVALVQKSDDSLIVDVRDTGRQTSELRRHDSNMDINFHVDSCDVVALLCRRTAMEGGASLLTSSLAVRDEIARLRPHLLEVLEAPLPFAAVGPAARDGQPFFLSPVFGGDREDFTSRFYGARIRAVRGMAGAPELTAEQLEAVDLIDKIAADPNLSCELDFQPGDLQLVNNHLVYHARTAFTDHPDPDRRRHLLRLWLAVPDSRRLPETFREAWGRVEPGVVRGGVLSWQLRRNEAGRYQREQARELGMLV
ncbi:Taurine catabolism dioxygenase TauD, TfdA family [Lentzea waywayandensis]|uniref:Taurine catabolism dioxygenase TauD, TfdA family n=2 Tax=Lentzea waywayandensis TaxID=84724 RepID=A0A1I6FIX9_9PSEU|nr:Taurine catabolism dioxygenase TauD, TfdA family [Lentzea waywayandensis]